MTKIIKNYDPPTTKGVGPEPIYPWETWFKKIVTESSTEKKIGFKIFKTDYGCTTPTMVRAIKREAVKRQLKLSIYREADGIVIMLVDTPPVNFPFPRD